MPRAVPTAGQYDAFISYGHAGDQELAGALELGLERLARPWYRLHALRIFRDDSSLSVNSALWASIQAAIDRSRFLIFMASATSASSHWVNDEVAHWVKTRGTDQLLLVLTEGECVWDGGSAQFDRDRSTAVPEALWTAFAEEPRYLDLRWARAEHQLDLRNSRFRSAVADLAAAIRGVDKDDLEGIDVRLHRRAMRLAKFAVATLVLLLLTAVGAGVLATHNANRARREARIALSRQLAAAALSNADQRADLALLLGLESYRADPSPTARQSVLVGLLASQHVLHDLNAFSAPVRAVAFSPDGRTVATGDNNGEVALWDVASGTQVGSALRGHADVVRSVAFSPDGRLVGSGSSDGSVVLWDPRDQSEVARLVAGTGAVRSVVFSPDGSLLAGGGDDPSTPSGGMVVLWSVADHAPSGEPLRGVAGSVTSVAFDPTGDVLASGDTEKNVILWDMRMRQRLGDPLTGHTGVVTGVAFGTEGRLAASSYDGTVVVWNVTTRLPEAPLGPFAGVAWNVAFSPDGKMIAISLDQTVQLFDAATRRSLGEPFVHHAGPVWQAAFSPDGQQLATASSDRRAVIWTLAPRPPFARILTQQSVWASAVSPDGKRFATGSDRGEVTLWDAATRQPLGEPLAGVPSTILTLAFSPDGRTLAAGATDHSVALWDVAQRRQVGTLHGHREPVTTVAFAPDGRRLASGSLDHSVILWDVAGQRALGAPLSNPDTQVWGLAFTPDGRTLATDGGPGGGVAFWDVEGQPRQRATGEGDPTFRSVTALGIAASPDGRLVASANTGGSIVLWDARTGTRTDELVTGRSVVVQTVAFSPDGRLLASGAQDGRIVLWDVASGQQIGPPLALHSQAVLNLGFSADGNELISGGPGEAVVWDLRFRSWRATACQLVHRNLTLDEWRRFLGQGSYHRTCAD